MHVLRLGRQRCAGWCPAAGRGPDRSLAGSQPQARARELSDAERAAAAAVRQLRQDLRDEKAAHDEAVRNGYLLL